MPIQVGSPLTLTLRFRDQLDVDGVLSDEGPLPLPGRVLRLVVMKPDGTVFEGPTPEMIGDEDDGVAVAEIEADTLDQSGVWRAQAFADSYPGPVYAFPVAANLPAPS